MSLQHLGVLSMTNMDPPFPISEMYYRKSKYYPILQAKFTPPRPPPPPAPEFLHATIPEFLHHPGSVSKI